MPGTTVQSKTENAMRNFVEVAVNRIIRKRSRKKSIVSAEFIMYYIYHLFYILFIVKTVLEIVVSRVM